MCVLYDPVLLMHQYSVQIGQHALSTPLQLLLLLQELLVLHAHSLLFLASNCLCGKHSGRCIIEKERMKRLNITRDAARTLVKHHTPKIMIPALFFLSVLHAQG